MNKRKGGYDQDPERSRTPPPGSMFEEPDDEYGRPSSSGSRQKNFQAPVGLGLVVARVIQKHNVRNKTWKPGYIYITVFM